MLTSLTVCRNMSGQKKPQIEQPYGNYFWRASYGIFSKFCSKSLKLVVALERKSMNR